MVEKIARKDTKSYFMAHLNSYAQEPGAEIALYSWDLDGDGQPDDLDSSATGVQRWTNRPVVTHTYTQTGTKTITLWVMDTFGSIGRDTVSVIVSDCP